MPTDQFLTGFPHPEPLVPEDLVNISDTNLAPMPLDDFLEAMGREEPAPEEAVFETAAGFQIPNVADFSARQLLDGRDTLYPGHANIPCLGVRTDSDSAGPAKDILLEQYHQWGLELRCHTCGKDLSGGKMVNGYFLEDVWIGDHQPPTSAYNWPAKMREIIFFTQTLNIQVVESRNRRFQTRYPVPAKLTSLFQGQRPHPYPLYPKNKVLPQRYIYPQCEACSRLQSSSL